MKPTGTYVTASTAGESFQAFIPNPLPPDRAVKLANRDHDRIYIHDHYVRILDEGTEPLPR